jgi:chemotaxis protein MotB
LFGTHGVVRRIFLLTAAVSLGACGVSQELYDTRTNELDRTRGDLTKTQGELAAARARSDEDSTAREHAAVIEAEYLKLKKDLNATEKQLEELKDARRLSEQRSELFRSLTERVRSPAIVELRKGKMTVRVPSALLFEPGRAELKPEGQAVLRVVAAALKDVPDRDFLVGAHTDAQLRGGVFKSNWDLSAARAVATARFLQQEGVSPSRLGAAAYSEFDPRVQAPATPEERAANDRVEIVLMPSLEELPAAPQINPAGEPQRILVPSPVPAPSSPATPLPLPPTPPRR